MNVYLSQVDLLESRRNEPIWIRTRLSDFLFRAAIFCTTRTFLRVRMTLTKYFILF